MKWSINVEELHWDIDNLEFHINAVIYILKADLYSEIKSKDKFINQIEEILP